VSTQFKYQISARAPVLPPATPARRMKMSAGRRAAVRQSRGLNFNPQPNANPAEHRQLSAPFRQRAAPVRLHHLWRRLPPGGPFRLIRVRPTPPDPASTRYVDPVSSPLDLIGPRRAALLQRLCVEDGAAEPIRRSRFERRVVERRAAPPPPHLTCRARTATRGAMPACRHRRRSGRQQPSPTATSSTIGVWIMCMANHQSAPDPSPQARSGL